MIRLSFVDTEFARKIGLMAAEEVTAKGSGEKNFSVPLAKGVTLSAAGLTLRDQTVAIGDLSDVGRRLLGHTLGMILGRELFDAARCELTSVEVSSRCSMTRARHVEPGSNSRH
jgi:hypothetical protein